MTPFVKPAVIECGVVAAGVGLSVSSLTHDVTCATSCALRDARPDATSDLQTRQVRRALVGAEGSG
jgi:hypothetical protein